LKLLQNPVVARCLSWHLELITNIDNATACNIWSYIDLLRIAKTGERNIGPLVQREKFLPIRRSPASRVNNEDGL